MCLNARGRAAIFLKTFALSSGIFESKGICTCLWGIALYRLPVPKLDLLCFWKVKTSNKNNCSITVYAKKKISCKLIISLIYTLYSDSEYKTSGELCWFLCRTVHQAGTGSPFIRGSWALLVSSALTAEVTERIELLCRLGKGVCNVQILFEAQCLDMISEEL